MTPLEPTRCLTCGHDKSKHIYEEGACRPGVECVCLGFATKPQADPTPLADAYKRLREVLIFYSDKTLYTGRRSHPENHSDDLHWDSGALARDALAEITKLEGGE